MSRHSDFPPLTGNATHTRSNQPNRRWMRVGLIAWVGLAVVGWLVYFAFVLGWPGNYWLAKVYSASILGLVPLGLTAILTTPIFGIAFGILAIASLNVSWRSRARQGAKQLLVILLIQIMAIAALLPSGILVMSTSDRLTIAPWQTTYRALYVSPLDDNYGDLMLVKCRWFGFCRQVYRSYTDVISSEEAYLEFDAEANQVKLHLESRWVYVRSPGSPACKEILRSDDPYGKCEP